MKKYVSLFLAVTLVFSLMSFTVRGAETLTYTKSLSWNYHGASAEPRFGYYTIPTAGNEGNLRWHIARPTMDGISSGKKVIVMRYDISTVKGYASRAELLLPPLESYRGTTVMNLHKITTTDWYVNANANRACTLDINPVPFQSVDLTNIATYATDTEIAAADRISVDVTDYVNSLIAENKDATYFNIALAAPDGDGIIEIKTNTTEKNWMLANHVPTLNIEYVNLVPPTVSITSPVDTTVFENEPISLSATVTCDAEATLTSVKFYVDDVEQAAPAVSGNIYSMNFSGGLPVGTHVLKVSATDSQNLTKTATKELSVLPEGEIINDPVTINNVGYSQTSPLKVGAFKYGRKGVYYGVDITSAPLINAFSLAIRDLSDNAQQQAAFSVAIPDVMSNISEATMTMPTYAMNKTGLTLSFYEVTDGWDGTIIINSNVADNSYPIYDISKPICTVTFPSLNLVKASDNSCVFSFDVKPLLTYFAERGKSTANFVVSAGGTQSAMGIVNTYTDGGNQLSVFSKYAKIDFVTTTNQRPVISEVSVDSGCVLAETAYNLSANITDDSSIDSVTATCDGEAVSLLAAGDNYSAIMPPLSSGKHNIAITAVDDNGVRSVYEKTVLATTFDLSDKKITEVSRTADSVSVKASVNVANATGGPKDVLVILAYYDATNCMRGFTYGSETVQNNQSGVLVETDDVLTLPLAFSGYTAKMFVWDNIDNIKSLDGVMPYVLEQ